MNNLKNIKITFERPKNLANVNKYEFIKKPSIIEGGGLQAQIIMIKEEISLYELIEDFMDAQDISQDLLGDNNHYSYLVAGILSLSLNLPLSIKVFPDEYKDILNAIKDNLKLNQNMIKDLSKNNENIDKILEALTNEGFLHKNKNNEYIIRKKVLFNIHVNYEIEEQ